MSNDDSAPGVVVIFDIDGTLLDSVAFHHAALIATYASLGVGLGSRSLSEFPHYTDSAIFSQLIEESRGGLATAGELERLDERLEREYARLQFASAVNPIAGAGALLGSLHADRRFEIGFATGAMRRASLQKLRLLGVDPEGALIATASEFQTRERIVSEAVRLAVAQRRRRVRVVSIGDGIWDQRAAEQLAIPFLAVESGTHTFGPGPVLRVPDLESLTPQTLWDLSRDLAIPSAEDVDRDARPTADRITDV
jgi:phosphoglycolate phosphatase-like HAD superfamily hydrolase